MILSPPCRNTGGEREREGDEKERAALNNPTIKNNQVSTLKSLRCEILALQSAVEAVLWAELPGAAVGPAIWPAVRVGPGYTSTPLGLLFLAYAEETLLVFSPPIMHCSQTTRRY